MTRVSGIFVYPVKSCAGIEMDHSTVGPTGFRFDRRWMVVGRDGNFLSQRTHPKMALVKVQIVHDQMLLSAPNFNGISVPIEREPAPTTRATVWKDECAVLDEGREIAAWFSEVLGVGARLVRLADDDARPLGTPTAQPGDRVSFADAYPFLLLSEASLEGLNRRMSLPISMDRFRPNIVVSGCGAHAEDRWRHVRIGEVDFRVAKPCSRCVVTTTNQQTGELGREPLRTLATYRLEDGEVLFGQNLIHGGRGVVAKGDDVVVLAVQR